MIFHPRATRIAAVALTGVAALALSACGSTGTSASGGGDAGGVVTIDYLHRLPDGEGMTLVKDIVAKWNASHPEIQVNATKFDGKSTEMILKLETDAKAGTAPCLAQVGYGEVPQLYTKGLLADVSSEAAGYADHYSDGALAGMKVGNATVGLPQDVGPLVYYYNAAEFERLGITPPTTAAELESVAATAAAAGKYAVAFTPDEAQNWLTGQAAASGDVWFRAADDQWKVDTTGAGSKKVAAVWQDVLDKKEAFVGGRWSDEFTKALVDGQLIGHIGAAWEAGFLLDPLDGTPSAGQWRVAQLPDFGAGAMTGPDGGSGVAVMKGCAHPEQAMEFTDWLNTQVDDLTSQGLVVAAKGTPKTSAKALAQFGGQDVAAELSKATENLNPDFAYIPGFPALSSMNEVAAAAGNGSGKVIDVFDNAQTTAVSTLENLGLPVAK
ncbi:ABC transporter substrate-binding protein [Microbacterium sp. B19]|uniref:ABC transporter substrate-binding protein n=1 Tax=Microbacterium sp. B19 TaxID=96765 RepID=UPI0003478434|nr:extracellular solute-binding protein [Microbacterium sp. B19]